MNEMNVEKKPNKLVLEPKIEKIYWIVKCPLNKGAEYRYDLVCPYCEYYKGVEWNNSHRVKCTYSES